MQQTSKVTVAIDGDTIRSKAGSSSIELGGYVVDEGSIEGAGYTRDMVYTERLTQTVIRTTLMHVGDTDLLKLSKSRDVTVSYTTDTKNVYVLTGALALRVGPLKGGECEVAFAGMDIAHSKGK
jgi:hypothetical protein